MIELMKKAMFTGIGFAALTKDKVEELVQGLMEQGKMSQQEGEKLVDDIMKSSKDAQEEMSQRIENMVHEGFAKVNFAKMTDVENLKSEIADLKERLHRLEEKGQ